MAQAVQTVVAIILATLTAAILIITPFYMKWLAKRNTLFTMVDEGKAIAIMRGGEFDHMLMRYRGFHLNDPRMPWYNKNIDDWQILPNEPGKFYIDRFPLLQWLGIDYLGIPGLALTRYRYRFVWNEVTTNDAGKECIKPRDEMTDFIYVKDKQYAYILETVKTKDRLPVDVPFTVTTYTTNAYKSLFRAGNWIGQVFTASSRRGRDFVGAHTYDELKSETAEGSDRVDIKNNFSQPIIALTKKLPDEDSATARGLDGLYGQGIRTADLMDVDLGGDSRVEYEKATVKKFTSEQDAIAIENDGRARANVIDMIGTAEAGVILKKGEATAKSLEARLKALGNSGRMGELIVQADAMQAEGPGRTIIWANSPFVQQQPGLAQLLNDAGIKTAADLKAFVQKMVQPSETA